MSIVNSELELLEFAKQKFSAKSYQQFSTVIPLWIRFQFADCNREPLLGS